MKVIVIIPAAGLGTRMAPAGKKGAPSKQFFEISGTPIVIHTLRVFARNQQISQIVVALRKNEMERFTRQLEKEKLAEKVKVVEGGRTPPGIRSQRAFSTQSGSRRHCAGARCRAAVCRR